jgi:hypothetical protein
MSDKVKDQEMSKLKEFVINKEFKKAYAHLGTLNLEQPISSYNLAYVKFHEGFPVQARAILERLKFNGLYSKEINNGLSYIKDELALTMIESESTKLYQLALNSTSLPKAFFPSIAALMGIIFLLLVKKNQKIFGLIAVIVCVFCMVVFYRVNSFQVEINQQAVTIYRGPSKIFEEMQILPIGARFIATKKSDEWKYIEYPSMFKGWIKSVKAIKQ